MIFLKTRNLILSAELCLWKQGIGDTKQINVFCRSVIDMQPKIPYICAS